MKKVLLALTIMLALSSSSFAQAYTETSSTLSLGYGIGNIWSSLMKLGGESVSATGPIALTYERGVSEKISVGLAVGYASIKGTQNDGSGFNETLTNFSAVVRGNYHFGSSDKFDPYVGLGLGYYNFTYKNSNGDQGAFIIPSALAVSAQLGAKYYFSSNFGAYGEIGYVAGSILQLGLTYKLTQ
jgi:outer membrane protein W